jgi:DNA-binding IclR family transcriptional regulator
VTIDLHVARTSSDRVFELLDALASLGPGPHRLRDVAARAQLGASTTHRILQAAIRAGMVSKPQRGRYFLSAPPSPSPEPAIPARPPLAVSRRIRLGLAALQKATEQPVLLYVPLILDTPMRYCMAYFAPAQDELLSDAERLLVSDMVFCAPLTVDAPGRLILAHLSPERSSERARSYVYGPSPVAGWNTLAAPLRRYGQIAGVICVTARAPWMGRYSDHALHRLLRLARELGDELPAEEVRQ